MAVLNRRRTAILAAAALAAAGACDHPVEPFGDYVLVHSVLQADSDTARLRLERVDPEGSTWASIDDAQVVLEGPESTVLTWVPGPPCVDTATLPIRRDTGCYVGAPAGAVTAGSEYRLSASLAAGQEVRGRTRVPLPPGLELLEEPWIRWPLPHPFVAVRVVWDAGGGVGRVEARLGALEGHERNGAWHSGCSLELDPFAHDPRTGPAEIRIRDIGCPFDWDTLAVEVRSTAYDTAYARYFEQAGPTSKGISFSNASAGLDGALGVFGAAATAVDTFFVMREEPPS